MLESVALSRGQGLDVTVQKAHQVAFAITNYPIAQNKIMHTSRDVDGIDLDIGVISDGCADIRRRLIDEQGAAHEAAGGGG